MSLRTICCLPWILIGCLTFAISDAESAPKFFSISEFDKSGVKGGFIDETGAIIMQPTADIFPSLNGNNRGYFKEGLEPVQVQLKTKWPALAWGYLDAKLQFAIAPQFEMACPFSEGLAAARIKKQPWYFGYIDSTGKFIIPPQFEEAHPFSEGLAQVVNSEHIMGFIDRSGNWAIQPQYYVRSPQSNFSEGLACVGKKVTPEGDSSKRKKPFSSCLWGYIDKKGELIIDFKFENASGFHEGLAAVCENESFGYIDKTGAYAIPSIYRKAWFFSEGLARVETNEGKMAFINIKGDIIFTVDRGRWADPFSEGLANVSLYERDRKPIWGYIDHTGNFAIKPQFQKAEPFVQGLARVVLNGEVGYIDKSGRFVWKIRIPEMSFPVQN